MLFDMVFDDSNQEYNYTFELTPDLVFAACVARECAMVWGKNQLLMV